MTEQQKKESADAAATASSTQSTIINTGADAEGSKKPEISGKEQLRKLLADVKRTLEKESPRREPLDSLHEVVQKHIARIRDGSLAQVAGSPVSGEASGDSPEAKSEEAKAEKERQDYLYASLLPGVASALVGYKRLSKPQISALVRRGIQQLLELLALELRQETTTSPGLAESLRPLLDYRKPFYATHD